MQIIQFNSIKLDEQLWTPAYPVPGFQSIPVQYKLESKSTTGVLKTEFYTVTNFRPTNFIDEEAYVVSLTKINSLLAII
jgi:hypothetical protein